MPEAFEEAGYEVPEALTSRIAENGDTPWRSGLGVATATGGPATDRGEDTMRRTQPLEVYDP